MKTCTNCYQDKGHDEFHKVKRHKDGLAYFCKQCTCEKARNNRLAKLDEYKEKARIKSRTCQRQKQTTKEFQKRPEEVEKSRARNRLWSKNNRIKKNAHGLVYKALAKGKLLKSTCEKCGEEKTEAHHRDYSKPLEVMWLCRVHHAEIHREEREHQRHGQL